MLVVKIYGTDFKETETLLGFKAAKSTLYYLMCTRSSLTNILAVGNLEKKQMQIVHLTNENA
jgi:hypothetical protein